MLDWRPSSAWLTRLSQAHTRLEAFLTMTDTFVPGSHQVWGLSHHDWHICPSLMLDYKAFITMTDMFIPDSHRTGGLSHQRPFCSVTVKNLQILSTYRLFGCNHLFSKYKCIYALLINDAWGGKTPHFVIKIFTSWLNEYCMELYWQPIYEIEHQ